ncbi:hypothetical protein BMT55_09795 [Listeria newyorkensis]|uniref:DUF1433 domain-containing protein n=2 Tax=Listeria newyorkensis TaxID=1497681 RepID=A0ABX4XMG2_9LIST|nr:MULTISPECIES: DUF1433 domain-containing protein [Listeria]KGL38140.1 hypothetical protein EP56_16730 [Listeriaceae bacterium FSL A5-0209]KGL39308.1 hypothetical protein EP58_14195 [Listeria newyorkensis]PNP91987.1 hypothetical protein BMT55_09795 [Listeria newyorkensis]WAO22256.1 DUF1433 domain-containing protein [Listeria newyorkensis]
MKKWLIVSSILLVLIFIIAGGVYIMKEKENQKAEDELERLVSVEKPRIEKYFKYNFTGVNKVTVTGAEIHPTGIPHIKGYVNDDKDLYFNAAIHKDHFEGDLSIPYGLEEMQKSDLSVSEIQEREQGSKE